MRSGGRIPLCAAALAAILFSLSVPPAAPADDQRQDAARSVDRLKSMAEAQHEIVMIFLKKKDFAGAEREAHKIFEMGWPEDQEGLLLKELLGLSNEFLQAGQAAAGVRLMDKHQNRFKLPKSQVAIWKEKGYAYKSMGEDDKALDCFRKAQQLEKSLP